MQFSEEKQEDTDTNLANTEKQIYPHTVLIVIVTVFLKHWLQSNGRLHLWDVTGSTSKENNAI